MADAITTNASLTASGFIDENTLKRLTPREWYDASGDPDEWTYWHNEAWSELKRWLSDKHGVEESDLADISELAPAAIHYVLYLAFMTANDDKRSDRHLQLYRDRRAVIAASLSSSTSDSLIASGLGIDLHRN